MDYAAYQKKFTDALKTQEPRGQEPRGQEAQEAQEIFVSDKKNGAAAAAERIYRNNFIFSLVEVLSEGFPVAQKLLGAELFTQVAKDFIRVRPPQGADLSTYGVGFASFIKAHPALSPLAYLGDVARIEEACSEIYYAPPPKPLDLTAIQKLSDDVLAQRIFKLSAKVRVLDLKGAADEIWQAHQSSETPPEMELAPEKRSLLLCEKEEGIELFTLTPDLAFFVRQFETPTSLAATLAATLKEFPSFDLANGLSLCLTKKLFEGGTDGNT